MIEKHAFGNFVPPNSKYLILGSFTGRQAVQDSKVKDPAYDWFYATKRNQFWPLLEEVYGLPLRNKTARQKLFGDLGIAIADIILQCERKSGNNLDMNLINIVYNTEAIHEMLGKNSIRTIFFSSRFVEKKFKQIFKEATENHSNINLITLPSPSPRYAAISKAEKIKVISLKRNQNT
jgi:hypoxanthine-DNA glycosylase